MGENAPAKLEDILKYNNGRVGVVVDAKEAHVFNTKYRKSLSKLLNNYSSGEILLQSFNPFFMLSVRNKLEGIATGQLICRSKTILDSLKTPRSFAYLYERVISIICIIARTDLINMENHSDVKWHKRTKLFISKNENDKVEDNLEKLLDRIEESIENGKSKMNAFIDKMQLKVVKATAELTNKPVLAFTINSENDLDKMENLYIVSYIVDFANDCIEKYIDKIKEHNRDNEEK